MKIKIHLKNKIYAKDSNSDRIINVPFINMDILPVIREQDGVCYWLYGGFYHELIETPEEINNMFEQYHKEEKAKLL